MTSHTTKTKLHICCIRLQSTTTTAVESSTFPQLRNRTVSVVREQIQFIHILVVWQGLIYYH